MNLRKTKLIKRNNEFLEGITSNHLFLLLQCKDLELGLGFRNNKCKHLTGTWESCWRHRGCSWSPPATGRRRSWGGDRWWYCCCCCWWWWCSWSPRTTVWRRSSGGDDIIQQWKVKYENIAKRSASLSNCCSAVSFQKGIANGFHNYKISNNLLAQMLRRIIRRGPDTHREAENLCNFSSLLGRLKRLNFFSFPSNFFFSFFFSIFLSYHYMCTSRLVILYFIQPAREGPARWER